jgi:hypothetical protein
MNNLSFQKWFNLREADEYFPDMKNALEVFMKPDETIYISPASIVDSNLTDTHKPFIYLESTDKVYLGISEGYHDNLIYQKIKEDANIGLQLRKAYDGIHESHSDVVAAVGRIGYRVDFSKLEYRLPRNNLKKFLYGDDQTKWPERVSILAVIPNSIKRIFDQIDLISIYKTPISVAAASCKKLQEDGEILDPLKTVVFLNNKAYMFNEFISHAQSVQSITKPEPVIQREPSKDMKKEPVSFFPKDFKPKTWKDARKWAGLPPTIGDWNTNRQ